MVDLCPVVNWSDSWMVVWKMDQKSLFMVQNVWYLNGPPGHVTTFQYQTPKLSIIQMNLMFRCLVFRWLLHFKEKCSKYLKSLKASESCSDSKVQFLTNVDGLKQKTFFRSSTRLWRHAWNKKLFFRSSTKLWPRFDTWRHTCNNKTFYFQEKQDRSATCCCCDLTLALDVTHETKKLLFFKNNKTGLQPVAVSSLWLMTSHILRYVCNGRERTGPPARLSPFIEHCL